MPVLWRYFNPRAPCGARRVPVRSAPAVQYFNPRAPCGARRLETSAFPLMRYFNPRAPCGARHVSHEYGGNAQNDFNPRAPCGARPFLATLQAPGKRISIHAPRVGRDTSAGLQSVRGLEFQSTRPVWGATLPFSTIPFNSSFQSTRPVWGATKARDRLHVLVRNFNPRAPCGARLWVPRPRKNSQRNFNPRAPCGARLYGVSSHLVHVCISIHAPRVGRDAS